MSARRDNKEQEMIARIRSPEVGYCERTKMVQLQMGNMASCRGDRGDELCHVGAIHSLPITLTELWNKIPAPQEPTSVNLETESIIRLDRACFGAIRDLASGSADTREALRTMSFDGRGGMQLMSELSWCLLGQT